ncbi:hypothetical protein SEA_HANNACONDA_231 [Mycobacterium phage Hannaconda]|nr:hypothetical protein SEA_HANNACONDA_231 [Mycobacterium phage Hannaconda]QPO16835.1 hypothetical protein SEA_KASHFLOW_233 [Mycobacterium phage KashFlow]
MNREQRARALRSALRRALRRNDGPSAAVIRYQLHEIEDTKPRQS